MNFVVNEAVGAVIFFGEVEGYRLPLGGSAEFLLDRPVAPNQTCSHSSALLGMLHALENYSINEGEPVDEERASFGGLQNQWAYYDYDDAFDALTYKYPLGSRPMAAVPNRLHTVEIKGVRCVAGTPLYVASARPEHSRGQRE